jgi:hypothetical protein
MERDTFLWDFKFVVWICSVWTLAKRAKNNDGGKKKGTPVIYRHSTSANRQRP